MAHDRTALHIGTDSDLVVLLASALGGYPAGMALHDLLEGFEEQLAALESSEHSVRLFTANAIIFKTTQVSLFANAVLFKSVSASFTEDAWLTFRTTASFTEDAIKKRTEGPVSHTVDAIILDTQLGSFTADAVIS